MIFDTYGEHIFFDGAMGTMLGAFGRKPGEKPDILNITLPKAVEKVHRMYVEAGSDIICANTFGSNALGLSGTGYSPAQVITAAVTIAKRACSGHTKVALDIGPLGQLLEPLGEIESERANELFKEMAVVGEMHGADFAAIETMSDIEEMKIAIAAVKDNTKLPVLATMTFDKTGHTYMGCTPETFVDAAEKLGASAVGMNCSLTPSMMLDTAKRFANVTTLPLIIKLNAGLPDGADGGYQTGPEEFATQMIPYAKIGARIIGGCCGTTPEYIKALRKVFKAN